MRFMTIPLIALVGVSTVVTAAPSAVNGEAAIVHAGLPAHVAVPVNLHLAEDQSSISAKQDSSPENVEANTWVSSCWYDPNNKLNWVKPSDAPRCERACKCHGGPGTDKMDCSPSSKYFCGGYLNCVCVLKRKPGILGSPCGGSGRFSGC